MAEKEQIPAGSQGPEEEVFEAPVEDAGEPVAEEPTPEKFAGKSDEDLKQSYANLEKKFGEQGQRIGELTKNLEAFQQGTQPQEEQPVSYNEQLQGVISQIDDGTLDYGQAIVEAAKLGAAQTEQMIAQKYSEYDQKRLAQEHMDKFTSDNSDFVGLRDSGALDEIKSTDPMHDNFSAYFKYKGMEETKAAFENGKAEATKLAEGQIPSTKVVSQSGTQVHQANKAKGPVSPAERKQNMLDSLKASRET